MTIEHRLVDQTVKLAEALVSDFDIVDLLAHVTELCVELAEVAAAGILVTVDGELRVMASSSEAVRVLELYEIQSDSGPCWDCSQTAAPTVSEDFDTDTARWPDFVPVAIAAGFHSVHAVPMRLRGTTIGSLGLFKTERGLISPEHVRTAQMLADIATVAILQHSAVQDATLVGEQLQQALDSRIVIEQAKGIVAEHLGVGLDDAFNALRGHARNSNLRLADLARDVSDGTVSADELLAPRARPSKPRHIPPPPPPQPRRT